MIKINVEWSKHLSIMSESFFNQKKNLCIDDVLYTGNICLAEMLDKCSSDRKKEFVKWMKKNRPEFDIKDILKHCKN